MAGGAHLHLRRHELRPDRARLGRRSALELAGAPAVSRHNIELLSHGYARWNKDGTPEALIELAPPEFEWHPNPADPEQKVRRGRQEVLAGLRDLEDAFEEFRIDVREVIPSGDKIAVVVRHRARGRGSGAEVERDEVHVWTFDGERPVRLDEYPTRDEALAALQTP